MPIRNSDGIILTEPGGALRADVAALGPQVIIGGDGVFGYASYGAEASMYSLNRGSGFVCQCTAGGPVAPIPFSVVTVDSSDASTQPQCEAESGVLTAWQNGVFEIGVQVLLTTPGFHVQVAIYTDLGYTGVPLSPAATPFGTPTSTGVGWYRVAQSTKGYPVGATPSTDPDAPGFIVSLSTIWYVSALNAGVLNAPHRFRFGIKNDTTTTRVIGINSRNTYCWMRWLRP